MSNDTIAAIGTAAGAAPRGIVRLSGKDALTIVRSRFHASEGHSSSGRESFRWTRGRFSLGRAGVEVALWEFRGPRTFTGEDAAEVHAPGAPALLDAILTACLRGGARLALPGEFTRRAFLCGRLDLTAAEAVAALIHASDEVERRAALAALEGGLERRVRDLEERILELLVPLEVALDFSDQDVEIEPPSGLVARLHALRDDLYEISEARRIEPRLGALRVVLRGPANAGKSSLFNLLVGEGRALVDARPGTTRDPVKAHVRLGSRSVLLVDTAGEDGPDRPVDALAQQRRRRWEREADLLVEVRALGRHAPLEAQESPGRLAVHTHLDQVERAPEGALALSAVTGEGEAAFRCALERALDRIAARSLSPLAVNARQAEAALKAAESLGRAVELAASSGASEFLAADLRFALARLGELLGCDLSSRVLDRIFSQFCIGK